MAQVWHLRARPQGALSRAIFSLDVVPDEPLGPGEVRIANRWLSVDPFMRGLLDEGGGYVPALPIGSAMTGGAVGEILESRAGAWPVGRRVFHNRGWRDLAVVPESDCEAIPDNAAPLQRYLGHLGMPGQTAYFGLLDVANAVESDVLFVSAAAGAVGSAVVQVARIKGLTIIASASGTEKCDALRRWGAHAVVDRLAEGTMREKLAAAAPDGISACFDNVGGDHLDAAIESARPDARFALCGMVASYGRGDALHLPQPMRLIAKRLRLRGFAAPDFDHRWAEFHEAMLGWTLSGALQSPETIREGLETMPAALIDVLSGGNIGKMLVRL